jgi:methyltransferase (TIGR00027 family)
VAVDLRNDWPAALADAGFHATQPTAWLAEGLLPYLPAEAQDRLFQLVTGHSAAGSRIAVEAFSMDLTAQADHERMARRERSARMRKLSGIDIDVDTLTYADGNRADAAGWLADHGWRVDAVPSEVEMTRLGRPAPDYEAEEIASSVLLRAELSGEAR